MLIEEISHDPALKSLLKDNRLFISILENLNSGVALIDKTGRFLLYNKKFLNLFGLDEESTIKNVNDQNWAEWQVFDENLETLHVDDHPVRKAAITGKDVKNQLVGVRLPSGGKITWMLISAIPIFDEKGSIEKTICNYMDVTDHKLADAALRESEQRYRQLNTTKDKLLSIISHDLKSPFTSIIGFSDLLVDSIEKNNLKSISEYATVIRDSSWRAMDLLSNLIEWSRLQAGGIEFNPKETDLISEIKEVAGLLKASAMQKSITISFNMPRQLILKADRHMLSSILRNLLSNAVKFTNTGGKIDISVSCKESHVIVEVSDNGVGMSEEVAGKLFNFETIVSTPGTQKETGTGLGIVICKEFISKHGGDICVDSKAGEGSKFIFTLPLKLPDACT